jgi:hypothetical protein
MAGGGNIVSPKGRVLPWTDGDALWLRRAVEREGKPRELVAQALVNRWAMLHDQPGPAAYPSLASFVRAYAQPVNPRWFPEGDIHLATLEAHAPRGAAHRADMIARAEARRDVHSTRKIFRDETLQAVTRALEGPVTLPAGVTEYAADSKSARATHGTPYRSLPGENAFWVRSPGVLYSIAPDHPTLSAGRALRVGGVHAGFGVIVLMGLLAVPFIVSGRASRRLGRRRRATPR